MPALQNLVILDRQSPTPVSHTFVPRDAKDGTGLLVESTGVPVGENRLTASMRKVGSKFKGRVTLSVPIVATETINGISVPKVVRTSYVSMDVTFDYLSSTQERQNVIGMFADALGSAKVFTMKTLVDLEGVYGA